MVHGYYIGSRWSYEDRLATRRKYLVLPAVEWSNGTQLDLSEWLTGIIWEQMEQCGLAGNMWRSLVLFGTRRAYGYGMKENK